MGRSIRLLTYTDGTARGGAESVLHQLVAGLPAHFEVTVLGPDAEVIGWIADGRPGTATEQVRSVRGKTDALGVLALRRAITRHRPDLLHANLTSLPSCQYALLAAASVRGLPVVAVEHSPLASPSPLSRSLKRWTSRRLAAHVAVGSTVAVEIEDLIGLARGSMRVIHNGVAVPEGAQTFDPTARPVIIGVGRLHQWKGFDLLVEAFAGLDRGTLLIVGDGPQRSQLEQLVAARGLTDRVCLLGWSDDVPALVAGSDLFALPSRLEALPLTLLEAMHLGVPVVATPVGSVPEAVEHGVTGLLVPVGDVGALRSAMQTLIDDPERRAVLAANGRERARSAFSEDSMVADYVALYHDILSRAS